MWKFTQRGYHFTLAHLLAIQGLYYILSGQVPSKCLALLWVIIYLSGIGVVVGAHRLWCHRSFKATFSLRVILMLLQTLAGHESIFDWCRGHRLHHKFSETAADPYNSKRGFFYSHIGWIFIEEEPEVKKAEETLDFSDLIKDPLVTFQKKYDWPMYLGICHGLPILLCYYFFIPNLYICLCLSYFRNVLSVHIAALGNSVAHSLLAKPYDFRTGAADASWLSLIIFGEGWHNFHHVFPWDYRNTDGDEPWKYYFSHARMLIDLFAWMGLAYDLKTVPSHVIRKRAERTGDGSYFAEQKDKLKLDLGEIRPGPWGWGDEDISQKDLSNTKIVNNLN